MALVQLERSQIASRPAGSDGRHLAILSRQSARQGVDAWCHLGDPSWQMPIPEFDQRGLLPVGVYDCSLVEMAARFGWNRHRQRLVRSFGDFLAHEIRNAEFSEPLYVNGSFVTDKDKPEDVDVVLDLRSAGEDRQWRGLALMWKERKWFRRQYDVDFWVNLPGQTNFADFFQYVGIKSAKFRGLAHIDRKGILRIT